MAGPAVRDSVDHHCHGLLASWQSAGAGVPEAIPRWRFCFAEADSPEVLASVPGLLGYRHFLAALAGWLGVAASPDPGALERAVVGDRDRRVAADPDRYLRELLGDAGLETLLVDTGLGGDRLKIDEFAAASGCTVREIVRVEAVAEKLLAGPRMAGGLAAFADLLAAQLEAELDAGAVGLKSIAAYRGGFPVVRPSPSQLRRDVGNAERARQAGRLEHPLLVAVCLWTAAELAAARQVPLQIHTGFGDRDVELHRADPTLLRGLFLDPRTEACPIVLLHCYPFVRQAAYLAATYPNVWMDLSLAIPLAEPAATALVAEALAVCPVPKLLAGSDGHSFPEMHWWGAKTWCRALDSVLAGDGSDQPQPEGAKQDDIRLILGGTARRLYRLPT